MSTQVARFAALVLLLAAVVVWLLAGANRGWTKTSVARKTLDDVTGIEGITYERRFVPGLDFLGAAVAGAAILTAASFLLRKKSIGPPNQ